MYFSTNGSFRLVETDFLASTNDFLCIFSETPGGESIFFYCLVETYFWTNPLFRLVESYFLSIENSMLLFTAFFLMLETIIEFSGNKF